MNQNQSTKGGHLQEVGFGEKTNNMLDANVDLQVKKKKIPRQKKSVLDVESTVFSEVNSTDSLGLLKNSSVADIKFENEIRNGNKLHPPAVARTIGSYGFSDFEDKARFTYLATLHQKKETLYPYDRYLKYGSDFTANIKSLHSAESVEAVVWCTNLYLGLNRHPKVIKDVQDCVEKFGTGSGTSAVSGGMSSLHVQLAQRLAELVGKEDAVLFPTGFTANLGALSSIMTPKDIVLMDKECHASIINGVLLSGAAFKTFRNNDVAHLEKRLLNDTGGFENIFVLIESVYGMTGEEAPIAEICSLKKKHSFKLFVDEAHSFGIYGENGGGFCQFRNCSNEVDFIMSTLSKATGSIGGFVACKKEYAAFMRISSNPYMFQACMPAADAQASLSALDIIKTDIKITERLWQNTSYFRSKVIAIGFNVEDSQSPVVPIYIKDDEKISGLCRYLYENGVYTNWISYPAVKKGKGRLRFIVSAGHTDENIKHTLSVLKDGGKLFQII